jgi:hypothetical protein
MIGLMAVCTPFLKPLKMKTSPSTPPSAGTKHPITVTDISSALQAPFLMSIRQMLKGTRCTLDCLPPEKVKELRSHTGKIMIEIDEIVAPILRLFPDRDPDK